MTFLSESSQGEVGDNREKCYLIYKCRKISVEAFCLGLILVICFYSPTLKRGGYVHLLVYVHL
jgi:hypothetical protein